MLLKKIQEFNIPIVESHNSITDPFIFIEYVKNLIGIEGFVIAWNSGYRVKIKTEEYLRIHKIKDALTFEKNILDMIINEKIDDAKAFMLEEDRVRVEKFEHNFWEGLNNFSKNLYFSLKTLDKACQGSKKNFALTAANSLDWVSKAVMFSCWDGNKNVREEVINIIKKNISTQTKVDNIRFVWDNYRWNYGEIE